MSRPAAVSPSTSYGGLGSRGHLIVKSHRPLPRFMCAVPVPPPNATVETLRNTVVAILAGQVSADGDAGVGPGGKANTEALSYSEHLKQQIVHDWRCESLVLELRQNAMIAPETREQDAADSEQSHTGTGFELSDEHECALLEHGDEINVWLSSGSALDSLRLPKLSSRHKYGLPNQPALSRSGMLLDDEHASPGLGSGNDADFSFEAMAARIRKPSEPSSHSSSVQNIPNGQFETSLRHRAAERGQRILTLGGNGNVRGIDAEGAYRGFTSPEQDRPATRGKLKRPSEQKRASDAGIYGQTATAKPPRKAVRAQSSGILNVPQAPVARASEPAVPTLNTAASSTRSPQLNNREIIQATQGAPSQAPTKAERQRHEKVRQAGQKGMPSQALVVGPGVQGKVGRMNSYDGGVESSGGNSPAGGDFGNKDAFVAFTAAGSEMNQARRPSETTRRISGKSGQSSNGDRPETSRRASETRTGGSGGRVSSSTAVAKSKPSSKQYVKLPERPELPPVRNLNPFDAHSRAETLPSMPAPQIPPARPISFDLEQDAAIAQALSDALNFGSSPSADLPSASMPGALPGMMSPLTVDGSETPVSGVNGTGDGAHQASAATEDPRRTESATPTMAGTSSAPRRGPLARNQPSHARSSPEDFRDAAPAADDLQDDGEDAEIDGATAPTQDRVSPERAPARPMTKAERRYQEVQMLLDAERKKQADAEVARKAAIARAEEDKQNLLDKLEQERRLKLERLRWQMWDEVRTRQAREQQVRAQQAQR